MKLALTVGFSLLIHLPWAQAKTQIVTSDEYKDVFENISSFSEGKSPADILLVFDIDETLLIVQKCLSESESQGFAGWLKTVMNCPAELTEEIVPTQIVQLQNLGYATFALTARGDNIIKPTERELSRNSLTFLDFPLGSDKNFEESFDTKSKMVLKDGVVYASGRNKGETLKIVLEKVQRSYKWIVFIDDNKKNINAMNKAYKDDQNVFVQIIHYTKFDH